MLYDNDPFERAGADALDLESQVALALADIDEVEDLDWMLQPEPVDETLDRVSGIEFGYAL